VVLVVGGLATAGAAVVGNGSVITAVAPVVVAAGMWAICVAPMRYALFGLTFLSLALDVTGEGPWDSPLAPLGALLSNNLDKSTPLPVPVSGALVMLGLLLLLHLHRNLSGSRIDAVGRVETARPLFWAVAVSFVAVIALCGWGSMHGGDFRMARVQVMSFVLLLVLAYFSAVSFRGLRDYRILGALVVAAAFIKSLNALYVANTRSLLTPDYATSHGDSVLFACATVLLIIRCVEEPVRKNVAWCLVLMPFLVGGMLANSRRLVWVQIAAALLMFWMVSRRTHAKRFLARALVASLPFIAAYVVVGWNTQSTSSWFAPIKTFQSVQGSEADSSTQYRDTENYNLLMSMRLNPLLGSGFGHPFTEFVTLPNISFFREYQFLPHNSILGVWVFAGPIGFTGLSLALVVGVYFAARSYTFARTPEQRLAAFMVPAIVLIHVVQCWGDIGFSERRSSYLVGPALAMAGQLAIITGAWRVRPAKTGISG
jgi:O-Antigen ligase